MLLNYSAPIHKGVIFGENISFRLGVRDIYMNEHINYLHLTLIAFFLPLTIKNCVDIWPLVLSQRPKSLIFH